MNAKRFFQTLSLCATVGLFLAGCSSDDPTPDPDDTRSITSKIALSLSRYCDDKGVWARPAWDRSDRAGLFVVGNGASAPVYATPVSGGGPESDFLFTFDAHEDADVTLIGFWPSNAGFTCENGLLKGSVPTQQIGTVLRRMVGKTTARLSPDMTCNISLTQLFCTMYVHVAQGDYAINKVVLTANGGEAIAGDLVINIGDWSVAASEKTISVAFSSPVDCSRAAQAIPVMIAPVTLSKGYTITLSDTAGKTHTIASEAAVKLEAGNRYDTEDTGSTGQTELVFCGDNMVYMIDAAHADADSYKNAVTWRWDATTIASTLGLAASRCTHLDDCKPVDNGKKLLMTSSYGWCVLLDLATSKVLFHTNASPNAHSAELLPGDRVAVACSTGDGDQNNSIQYYNVSEPNRPIGKVALESAHGVVWNAATQRLYAIGGQNLKIYKLQNWDSSSPSLELERTEQTPKSGLHDMTLVDDNTLCIAGRGAYLYDIATNRFTEMTHFSASTALKSVNYNIGTGECWYTDSTKPEGSQTWSTQTIRYVTDVNGTTTARTIKVPDLDMYKVRVVKW